MLIITNIYGGDSVMQNRTLIFDNKIFKETKYSGYFVSRCGKIVSIKIKGGCGSVDITKPRYHSCKIDKDGYKEVCLSMVVNGKQKRIYRRLHRLVYETWVGKIEGVIDHIDSDRTNNNISNLQDVSASKNVKLRYDRAGNRIFKGTKNDVEFTLSVIRFPELCEHLHCSESTIRAHLKDGKSFKNRDNDIINIYECND